MHAPVDQVCHLGAMDSLPAGNGGGHESTRGLVRHWGPYILTVLLVPGGIVIALLLLWRRWNQARQAVQDSAAA